MIIVIMGHLASINIATGGVFNTSKQVFRVKSQLGKFLTCKWFLRIQHQKSNILAGTQAAPPSIVFMKTSSSLYCQQIPILTEGR